MHASPLLHEAVHERGISIKRLAWRGDRLHLVLPVFADYFSTIGPTVTEACKARP